MLPQWELGPNRDGCCAERMLKLTSLPRPRADEMEAPPAPWLQRFDKPSRLLLHTLTSGPCGALAAFRALQRIRACDAPGQAFHWQIFTETLCAEEPVLRGPERTLTL
ncbi:hypothetical protein KIL84_008064 [Mauremys mutica]|uniref:Uncharacterized protein n=1 Tax=Mauremys mutica TaxID=74926 RepID=A0A9D3X327_9SAUR|nr:hypothetical protein KIL84_008064 [Mauremys mutica]